MRFRLRWLSNRNQAADHLAIRRAISAIRPPGATVQRSGCQARKIRRQIGQTIGKTKCAQSESVDGVRLRVGYNAVLRSPCLSSRSAENPANTEPTRARGDARAALPLRCGTATASHRRTAALYLRSLIPGGGCIYLGQARITPHFLLLRLV